MIPKPSTHQLLKLESDPYRGREDEIPTPADLGLPAKFAHWRPWQWAIIERILNSNKRFFVLCAPCGSGKSLLSEALAAISGWRTVLLTSTKGLQDQVSTEFGGLVTDIRGMSNYACAEAPRLGLVGGVEANNISAADAPCSTGYKCYRRMRGPEQCEYFRKYWEARQARNLVTNYQCWMYDAKRTLGEALHIPECDWEHQKTATDPDDLFTPVELLICDEADEALGELSRYVGIEIGRQECLCCHTVWPDPGKDLEGWKRWAGIEYRDIDSRVRKLETSLKGTDSGSWSQDLKLLKALRDKLYTLSKIHMDDDWIVDEGIDGEPKTKSRGRAGKSHHDVKAAFLSVSFAPLAPARFAEGCLWRGVQKIVLMSATVRKKTAELLGVSDDDMEFIELPSAFPASSRQIIHVPSIQMNYRNEQDDRLMMLWFQRLDAVLRFRVERGWKGIIHSVSYRRARFIVDNSEFKRYMLIHDSRNRAEIVEEFRRSKGPCILVSPSVGTGYDFAGDQARFQIISKIPFASVKDEIMKARQEKDPEYGIFLASQLLIQITGRGTRAEDDWCENIILDDNWLWAVKKMRKFLPQWWLEGLRWASGAEGPALDCPLPRSS